VLNQKIIIALKVLNQYLKNLSPPKVPNSLGFINIIHLLLRKWQSKIRIFLGRIPAGQAIRSRFFCPQRQKRAPLLSFSHLSAST
jgi:hypothetical protein